MTEWLKSPCGKGIARFASDGLGQGEITRARMSGWPDPLVERHDVMALSEAELQWNRLRGTGWTVARPQW